MEAVATANRAALSRRTAAVVAYATAHGVHAAALLEVGGEAAVVAAFSPAYAAVLPEERPRNKAAAVLGASGAFGGGRDGGRDAESAAPAALFRYRR